MKMTIPNDMTLSHMLIQKSKEQNNAYIRLLFVFRGMGICKYFLMYRLWEGELGNGKSREREHISHIPFILFKCFTMYLYFFKKETQVSYSVKSFYSLYASA